MRLGRGSGPLSWLAWSVGGLLAVLIVPSLLRTGELFWNRAPAQLPQQLAMGVAFLLYVVLLRAAAQRGDGLAFAAAGAAAALAFGAAYLMLYLRPEVPHSRVVVMLSGIVGAAAGLLPYLRPRHTVAAAVLAAVLTAGAARALPARPTAESGAVTRLLTTSHHRLVIRTVAGLVNTTGGDGGALVPHDDGFLLVTGRGELHQLDWSGDSLTAAAIPLAVPQNRERFVARHRDRPAPPRLRVTGLAVDTASRPEQVIVAHQYWNDDAGCLTMRVSAAPLPDAGAAGPGAWRTVFESRPCVPFEPPYSEWEVGGRLAWAPEGGLLLTLGDHGYDHDPATAFAQRTDADYGKVLHLDLAGGSEVVTVGHRNPQGLTVARDGRVWLAEHGPQGGDEINLVERGGNYGWPLTTYGTDYGRDVWPLSPGAHDHADFHEPAFAFVPAPGISAVIEVAGSAFPAWEGDLLAGALRARSLLRARIRGDRVMYVEPIPIGRRVRDLEQSADGRIVVFTDRGDLLIISPAPAMSRGEAVFQSCVACHTPGVETQAPSLRGVVGRRVARSEEFAYSESLQKAGGAWTPERLDAFLANPRAFAPGTLMWYQVSDPADRAAVIDYLATYR